MESKSLPPSPPASTSTKSSPESPSHRSPPSPSELTPPKSPQQLSPTNTSTPPRIGSSPLPPLPAEVFQIIIEHVPIYQRPRLRRVCKAWHSFLDAEPSFWSSLRAYTHAYDPAVIEHWTRIASINGRNKPGGGLESLEVLNAGRHIAGSARLVECVDDERLKRRLHHLFNAAEHACLATPGSVDHEHHDVKTLSTLRNLVIMSQPNSLNTVWLLHTFAETCRRPLFNSLRSVYVNANLVDLTIGGDFLSMWPSLETMTIEGTFGSQSSLKLPMRVKWHWQPLADQNAIAGPRPVMPDLQRIDLRRLFVSPDMCIPVVNNLRSLALTSVEWEGRALFRLLRYARHTLVSLELDDVYLFEKQGDEWNDFLENVNEKDPRLIDDEPPNQEEDIEYDAERPETPAPIILRSLKTLIVKAEATPPIWTSLEGVDQADDEVPYPTPQFVMPALRHFALNDVITEQDGSSDEIDAPLPALGRNAPGITRFELINSAATDQSVFQCIAAMDARIETLIFARSDVTDHLIMELVRLTPRLSYLDTRGCSFVSTQTVARLVQRLREEGNPPMRHVFVDAPTHMSTIDDLRAHWWLDFIGLLGREEGDFEGPGPGRPQARLQWKREGKLSHEAMYRRQWESEVARERQAAAQLEAFRLASGLQTTSRGGTASSSGSSSSMSSRLPSQTSMAAFLTGPNATQWPTTVGRQAMYIRQQGSGDFGSEQQSAPTQASRLPPKIMLREQVTPRPASPAQPREAREQTPGPMAVEKGGATG